MFDFAEKTTMGCLGIIFQLMYLVAFFVVVLFVGGVLVQALGIVGVVLAIAFVLYLRK